MSSLLGSTLRSAREWATPVRKKSAFLERGVLTPEEFVKAGDELVYRCPTWNWESGDGSKRKPYLPAGKQYLVTRQVPCRNRVSSMESDLHMEKAGGSDGGDGDDDWLVSTIIQRTEQVLNLEDEFDLLDEDGEVIEKPVSSEAAAPAGADGAGEEEDDEYADMDAFEDDNILEDDAAALAEPARRSEGGGGGGGEDHTIKVRTYDLSITYDKYYQTPRVWMIGRNTRDQPLTGEEMMEDVISDYANKTVTMESHPHVAGPHASIHPCQHGKVMKAIVRNLMRSTPETEEGGSEGAGDGTKVDGPSVEMYIFIFLKFVSSMIPTINYDFTMEVTADTQRAG